MICSFHCFGVYYIVFSPLSLAFSVVDVLLWKNTEWIITKLDHQHSRVSLKIVAIIFINCKIWLPLLILDQLGQVTKGKELKSNVMWEAIIHLDINLMLPFTKCLLMCCWYGYVKLAYYNFMSFKHILMSMMWMHINDINLFLWLWCPLTMSLSL